jgi:hypothetical protein
LKLVQEKAGKPLEAISTGKDFLGRIKVAQQLEKGWTNGQFYSATKKNESLSFIDKCMENITLSEAIQAQKTKSCMFSLICRL